MENVLAVFAFLIIPLSSIVLLFLKDLKKERRQNLNILLVINSLIFLTPLFLSYINTPNGAKLFDVFSSGPGAKYVWWYFYIFPFCVACQLALIVLKSIYVIEYLTAKERKQPRRD